MAGLNSLGETHIHTHVYTQTHTRTQQLLHGHKTLAAHAGSRNWVVIVPTSPPSSSEPSPVKPTHARLSETAENVGKLSFKWERGRLAHIQR